MRSVCFMHGKSGQRIAATKSVPPRLVLANFWWCLIRFIPLSDGSLALRCLPVTAWACKARFTGVPNSITPGFFAVFAILCLLGLVNVTLRLWQTRRFTVSIGLFLVGFAAVSARNQLDGLGATCFWKITCGKPLACF